MAERGGKSNDTPEPADFGAFDQRRLQEQANELLARVAAGPEGQSVKSYSLATMPAWMREAAAKQQQAQQLPPVSPSWEMGGEIPAGSPWLAPPRPFVAPAANPLFRRPEALGPAFLPGAAAAKPSPLLGPPGPPPAAVTTPPPLAPLVSLPTPTAKEPAEDFSGLYDVKGVRELVGNLGAPHYAEFADTMRQRMSAMLDIRGKIAAAKGSGDREEADRLSRSYTLQARELGAAQKAAEYGATEEGRRPSPAMAPPSASPALAPPPGPPERSNFGGVPQYTAAEDYPEAPPLAPLLPSPPPPAPPRAPVSPPPPVLPVKVPPPGPSFEDVVGLRHLREQAEQAASAAAAKVERIGAAGKPLPGVGTAEVEETRARAGVAPWLRRAREEIGGMGSAAPAGAMDRAEKLAEDYVKSLTKVGEVNEKAAKEEERRLQKEKLMGGARDVLFGDLGKSVGGAAKALAGFAFMGPTGAVAQRLFGGTMSGAARGFAMGGVAGGVAGAAAGLGNDMIGVGGDANPQAAATFSQSIDLLTTRLGTSTGADAWMNMLSKQLQEAGKASKSSGLRGFSESAAGYAGDLPWWVGIVPSVGMGASFGYGTIRAGYDKLTGAGPKKGARPELEAPPILPGVGSGMGSAMSYEAYAQSFGMSSLNASPLDQAKMQEQLSNMVGVLKEIRDNSEAFKNFTPGWR